MEEKFKVKNKRLSKYLYSLGFNRECKFDNEKEYWLGNKAGTLQGALELYFNMRKKNR